MKSLLRYIFSIILLLSAVMLCHAQTPTKNIKLKIQFIEKPAPDIQKQAKEYSDKNNYRDTASIKNDLYSLINKLKQNGYLLASVDSFFSDSIGYTAIIFTGKYYQWIKLNTDSVEKEYLSGIGYNRKYFEYNSFRQEELNSLMNRVVENCENKGYPFAKVYLENIELDSENVSAELKLKRNEFITYDSIIIKGTANVAPVYLYNYLNIYPGDVYNESQIKRISTRLKEIPFVSEARPSQITFSEKKSKVFLFLENKKASQFDGVIGILPDETTGKVNFTGDIRLKLQNSFRRGEIIDFNWKQIPPRSQDLKIRILYPFLFNTKFGIEGNLNIFRRDTIFTDVITNLGIQYSLGGNNFLKAFVNNKQSSLQTSTGFENITTLPPFADITIRSYGTTFHFEKLDYRFNPRKGYAFEATFSAGNRTIRKNSGINPVVYDSLRLKSTTYQAELIIDKYISLGGKNVLNISGKGGLINNPELFINELYRIGGLRTLRGFDEESIFVSSFLIGKIEYRFQLEQNSFLFLFYNQAWWQQDRKDFYLRDTPLGFGTGINFETKLGIMSVSYAVGKQFDNPIFFRNAKVHFGIVNLF